MVNKTKVGAIIQARYDSARLPGKVLMSLPFNSGKSILHHIVERVRNVKGVNKVIIATSDEENDLSIVQEAERIGADVFRGSKDDVLDRFYQTAKEFELDQVIRLTGDNPLVLKMEMEEGIKSHIKKEYDYTSNTGLPYGTSFEIVKAEALKRMLAEKPDKDESEHVTLYIRRNREKFLLQERKFDRDKTLNDVRLTIDYPSDYAMMNILMQILQEKNFFYSLVDLYQIFHDNPWLLEVNKKNIQKRQYRTFEEEYDDVAEVLTKHSFIHSLSKLKEIRKDEIRGR